MHMLAKISRHPAGRPVPLLSKERLGEVPSRLHDKNE
jgi:hypothetical protein